MRNIKHIGMAAVAGLIAVAAGYGRQSPSTPPRPQKAGCNIEYVYYKTKRWTVNAANPPRCSESTP